MSLSWSAFAGTALYLDTMVLRSTDSVTMKRR